MVLWREPIAGALGEGLRAHDSVADERQAIKVQHDAERTLDIPAQRVVLLESLYRLRVEQRRGGIERAPLGQRKEPLDVVVHTLELIMRVAPDVGDRAVAVVGAFP